MGLIGWLVRVILYAARPLAPVWNWGYKWLYPVIAGITGTAIYDKWDKIQAGIESLKKQVYEAIDRYIEGVPGEVKKSMELLLDHGPWYVRIIITPIYGYLYKRDPLILDLEFRVHHT